MKAFTLTELIFVIIIIAILNMTGLYYMKPHYLMNDTNFVMMKIKNTKYQAVGYSKNLQGLGNINYSIGCISMSKLDDTTGTNYKFHSKLSSVSPSTVNTLCFDQYGRIHNGSLDGNQSRLSSLLDRNVTITITHSGDSSRIIIYPFSGYIETKY